MKSPDTKYHLEKYLKRRKANPDKTPRAPSGFMKKQIEEKAREEEPVKPNP